VKRRGKKTGRDQAFDHQLAEGQGGRADERSGACKPVACDRGAARGRRSVVTSDRDDPDLVIGDDTSLFESLAGEFAELVIFDDDVSGSISGYRSNTMNYWQNS
jgi:hypothetical protein